jgi:2'-5' RNA ligase
MTERWRCFIAVPIDDGLRSRLADAMAGWKPDPRADGLRWIEADALHLTLAFLGDVDPSRVPALQQSIEDVAGRHLSVVVPTGRLGAFARPGSARVLWYGIQDADGAVRALADDLADALGLDRAEEPYRPHITLARARRGWLDLRGWIEKASLEAPDARLTVSAVDLMRSHLGQGPARYERLASVRLG